VGYRFPEVIQPAARKRTAPLVVVLIIGLVVAGAAAVYACCDYFQWGVDGMMPPDYMVVKQPGGDGRLYTYKATQVTRSSMTLLRNGELWLTIRNKAGSYEISDPRGTGKVVLKASAPRR